MRYHSIKQIACLCLVGAALVSPSLSQTVTIHSGWELFETSPGVTLFAGVPFEGVPLWNYNFGGAIGSQYVGRTDTIIYRPTDIVGPVGSTQPLVNVQMVAWQLKSVNPFDPDGAGPAPVGDYYLTLHGAPATDTGSVTFLSANNGTFTDTLDVYYDLRFGSLTGPIVVANGSCSLLNSLDTWDRDAGTNTVLRIAGVDYLLNGSDTTQDMWPDPVTHFSAGHDYVHVVVGTIPEPSGLALLGLGGLCLAIKTRRDRK